MKIHIETSSDKFSGTFDFIFDAEKKQHSITKEGQNKNYYHFVDIDKMRQSCEYDIMNDFLEFLQNGAYDPFDPDFNVSGVEIISLERV